MQTLKQTDKDYNKWLKENATFLKKFMQDVLYLDEENEVKVGNVNEYLQDRLNFQQQFEKAEQDVENAKKYANALQGLDVEFFFKDGDVVKKASKYQFHKDCKDYLLKRDGKFFKVLFNDKLTVKSATFLGFAKTNTDVDYQFEEKYKENDDVKFLSFFDFQYTYPSDKLFFNEGRFKTEKELDDEEYEKEYGNKLPKLGVY